MHKGVFSIWARLLAVLFSIAFFIVGVLPYSSFAATGIHKQINFQGKVVNDDGTNVTNNDYNFLFCLYTTDSPSTACTAGANNDAVWRESKTVTVTNGVFRTSLGDTTALPGSVDFNTDNIYLGVNFNSDGQMSPLIRFSAVPYAFNADKVHGLTVTDTTGTFTLANSKTLTVNNTLTLAGTDSQTITFQGTDTYVGRTTTDTLSNKTLTAPKFADLGYLADANGNELIILDTVSTAVNEITIANAATGGAPSITASGETNVGLTINSKAAGALTLDSGTTGTVNLGTGNNAKTIAIGTGTAGNTINIGTNNTTSDTISIGSALDNVSITGDQWSISDAGVLTVASCTGCGGGGSTLQAAYDAGNTITTDATGNITITLAELATPTTFEIFNADTAGVTAFEIDNQISSGTLTNGLLIEQSAAGTMTSAIQIAETAGTITDGILITGTLSNILNSDTIDITGAGAITGATGITLAASSTITGAGAVTLSSGGGAGLTLSSPSGQILVLADEMVLGEGEGGTPTLATIRGAQASGSNIAGADLVIAASNGTGSGGSGSLIFQTASAGSTASPPVFDSASSDLFAGDGATTVFNLAHTTSGSSRALLVGVSYRSTSSRTVSSVTFNGDALTKVGTANNSDSIASDLWYMAAPDTGSHNITVTFSVAPPSNPTPVGIGATSWTSVDQTTVIGTPATATGTSLAPSVNVSSDTDEVVVDALATRTDGTAGQQVTALTAGASQTERYEEVPNVIAVERVTAGGSSETGAATTTMSWAITSSANKEWAIIGVPLLPATSTTGVNTLVERMSIDQDGLVAVAGAFDANGIVTLGDGGDAVTIDGSSLTLQTTGAGSDITLNAVDQIILTDFTGGGSGCSALETNGSGVLTCGTDDTGGGGVSDGDKGDVTVSGSGTVWNVDFSSGSSGVTSSASGLERQGGGIGLLQGCSDKQVLKWNETTDVWECGPAGSDFTNFLDGNYTNNTTGFTDVDNNSDASDDIGFVAGANETWIFQMNVQFASPSAADSKWQITGTNAPTCDLNYQDVENTFAVSNIGCGASSGNWATGNSTQDTLIANGFIVAGASGSTLQLQFGQATASGTSTIYAGSYVRAWKITGADLAENYYSREVPLPAPGTVLTVDEELEEGVKRSSKPYDRNLIGIVTTQPGLVMGEAKAIPGTGRVLVALAGRVPVKVSTENGDIESGDFLTSSSTSGVAMKATKAGPIIGQALSSYSGEGEGTVVAFVKTGYAQGSTVADLLPEDFSYQENLAKVVLSRFVDHEEQLAADPNLSEIVTDRLAAGLEIITPRLVAKSVELDELSSATGKNITLNLGEEGNFVVKDKEGAEVIKFDSKGNAYFAGLLVADKIKANQIEGLEVLTNKIASLSSTLDGQDSAPTNESGLVLGQDTQRAFDEEVLGVLASKGGLIVEKAVNFKDETIFEKLVTLLSNVIFKGEVSFEKVPSFGKDTAGLAKIKRGEKFVFVEFEEEYKDEPIVNATLYIPRLTQQTFEEKIVSGDCVLPTTKEKCESTLMFETFAEDLQFAVTEKTQKGFMIMLSDYAPQDIFFSWVAISVKNPKTTDSSDILSEIEDLDLVVPSPTPENSLNSSTSSSFLDEAIVGSEEIIPSPASEGVFAPQ